jgi:serine protease AprX
MSNVIRGIQWVVQNRKSYGIRIVNLSLGAPSTTSYLDDPLAAAVEIAWHSGLVVVTSAGNNGPRPGTVTTPGHDPYVITVGAVDMSSTRDRRDDVVTPWSSRGQANSLVVKPDVVAPGRKIVSTSVNSSFLSLLYPERIVDGSYFRLSGTSQAAAAVSGVAALVLSANPGMTPNRVKWQLMSTANRLPDFGTDAQGAGYVNAATAIRPGIGAANGQVRPSNVVASVAYPLIKGKWPLRWRDLDYNGGVDSRGIPWVNVMWDNVLWDNVTWDNLLWDNVMWDNVLWDNVLWDNVLWDSVTWDSVTWDNVMWDSIGSLD